MSLHCPAERYVLNEITASSVQLQSKHLRYLQTRTVGLATPDCGAAKHMPIGFPHESWTSDSILPGGQKTNHERNRTDGQPSDATRGAAPHGMDRQEGGKTRGGRSTKSSPTETREGGKKKIEKNTDRVGESPSGGRAWSWTLRGGGACE